MLTVDGVDLAVHPRLLTMFPCNFYVGHMFNLVAKHIAIKGFATARLISLPWPVLAEPCSCVQVLGYGTEYPKGE